MSGNGPRLRRNVESSILVVLALLNAALNAVQIAEVLIGRYLKKAA